MTRPVVYLDWNATTPLREAARQAWIGALAVPGNPSSIHAEGRAAHRLVEEAREAVARLAGAVRANVIFTSSGTEANALALSPSIETAGEKRARDRLFISAIEHSSLLAPLSHLEAHGFETVRVMPDRDGRLAPEQVVAAIDEQTALVTLGLANAETGGVQGGGSTNDDEEDDDHAGDAAHEDV